MFQTAAGVRIPFPEKLSEQFQQDGDTLTGNLSFEKLADFVRAFYAELDEPLFFAKLLERFGVTRTDRLVTAWDTFSKEHPGEAQRLEIAGQTVPDMIRELQKIGMYKG